jgi:RNA polymerase primary sigma factor
MGNGLTQDSGMYVQPGLEEALSGFEDEGIDDLFSLVSSKREDDVLEEVAEEPQPISEFPSSGRAVGLYLRDISSRPLLTKEEEKTLAKEVYLSRKAFEHSFQSLKKSSLYRSCPQEVRSVLRESQTSPKGAMHRLHQLRQELDSAGRGTKNLESKLSYINRFKADYDTKCNELVERNLRLAVSIAKRYSNRGIPFLDLVQEGNLGLIKAADKFDYRRDTRFSTYATWWVRAQISRAVKTSKTTVNEPDYIGAARTKVRRVLAAQGGGLASDELSYDEKCRLIQDKTNLKLQTIERCLSTVPRTYSLDRGMDEEDFVPQFAQRETRSERDITAEQKERMLGMLKRTQLSHRENDILQSRYALDGHKYQTLQQVGDRYDLSKERVRQIEVVAMKKVLRTNKAMGLY